MGAPPPDAPCQRKCFRQAHTFGVCRLVVRHLSSDSNLFSCVHLWNALCGSSRAAKWRIRKGRNVCQYFRVKASGRKQSPGASVRDQSMTAWILQLRKKERRDNLVLGERAETSCESVEKASVVHDFRTRTETEEDEVETVAEQG